MTTRALGSAQCWASSCARVKTATTAVDSNYRSVGLGAVQLEVEQLVELGAIELGQDMVVTLEGDAVPVAGVLGFSWHCLQKMRLWLPVRQARLLGVRTRVVSQLVFLL